MTIKTLNNYLIYIGGRKMKKSSGINWYKLKRLDGKLLFLQNRELMLDYIKENKIKVFQKGNWFFEVE